MKIETINADQNTIAFMPEAVNTDGSAAMFEFTVPAGAKVAETDFHENFNETIYDLVRVITFTVEAKAIDIAPGENCFIPRSS
ncbi:MAG: hypothetical protein ABI416_05070 [Ginsengibacter sp.]